MSGLPWRKLLTSVQAGRSVDQTITYLLARQVASTTTQITEHTAGVRAFITIG